MLSLRSFGRIASREVRFEDQPSNYGKLVCEPPLGEADGKMMAVAVKATAEPRPSFEAGVTEGLFQAQLARPPH